MAYSKERKKVSEEASWKAKQEASRAALEAVTKSPKESAADKAKRAEEEKVRRAREKQARNLARQKNKEDYARQLKEYQDKRAKEKAEEKARREAEEKTRRESYEKARDSIGNTAEADGGKGRQAVTDYTRKLQEEYKKQQEDRGYAGSSSQARAQLRSSIKDIWNLSTAEARKELRGAYTQNSEAISALMNARSTVSGLVYDKAIGGFTGSLSNSALSLQAAALTVRNKEGMVELQKQILTQKLANRVVLDQIADAVSGQMHSLQASGTQIRNMVLLQRAYVAGYIKQTFGNPEFMANVAATVSIRVNNYVDALTNEKLTELNSKVDSIFLRADGKLASLTSRVNTALNQASRIDVLSAMNKQIDKLTNLTDKLDKSPVGRLVSPLIKDVISSTGKQIDGTFKGGAFSRTVQAIKDKVVGLQGRLNEAKKFVTEKVQMVRDYVNQLKEKAMAAVKVYADRVIGDIKSKISNALTGAVKGMF